MTILLFPGKISMKSYLLQNEALINYEKSTLKAIIKLAIKRFSNKDLERAELNQEALQIAIDLWQGRDSFTEREIHKIVFPSYRHCEDLSRNIAIALIDCAKA